MANEIEWTDELAVGAYLDYLGMSRGLSPRTLEIYGLALRRLKEFLQGKPLLDADGMELEAFCGLWLHRKGVVATSRKPYVAAVRSFYAWANDKGLLDDELGNPAKQVQQPKGGSRLPRSMSLSSAERLMWAPDLGTFVGIRDAAMLSLLMGCGLRVSGLTALNVGDLRTMQVDGRARLMLLVTEKGNRQRMVPLPREADSLLRVYMGHEELASMDRQVTNQQGKPDKVLFVNTKHPALAEHEHVGEARRLTRRSVHDMIQRYGRRVGIPEHELHPHAMRHLFGTELTEGDVPTITTQGLMGHVDPKSTAIYVELAMTKKMKVVDQHAPLAKMKTPVGEFLKRMPR